MPNQVCGTYNLHTTHYLKKVALFKESIVASKHFLDEILAVDVNSLFPETTAHMPNHTALIWI